MRDSKKKYLEEYEKYKDIEIGKVMISKPYPFGLVKVVDPDIKEFNNIDLICGNSKIKIIKPDWI